MIISYRRDSEKRYTDSVKEDGAKTELTRRRIFFIFFLVVTVRLIYTTTTDQTVQVFFFFAVVGVKSREVTVTVHGGKWCTTENFEGDLVILGEV